MEICSPEVKYSIAHLELYTSIVKQLIECTKYNHQTIDIRFMHLLMKELPLEDKQGAHIVSFLLKQHGESDERISMYLYLYKALELLYKK